MLKRYVTFAAWAISFLIALPAYAVCPGSYISGISLYGYADDWDAFVVCPRAIDRCESDTAGTNAFNLQCQANCLLGGCEAMITQIAEIPCTYRASGVIGEAPNESFWCTATGEVTLQCSCVPGDPPPS